MSYLDEYSRWQQREQDIQREHNRKELYTAKYNDTEQMSRVNKEVAKFGLSIRNTLGRMDELDYIANLFIGCQIALTLLFILAAAINSAKLFILVVVLMMVNRNVATRALNRWDNDN